MPLTLGLLIGIYIADETSFMILAVITLSSLTVSLVFKKHQNLMLIAGLAAGFFTHQYKLKNESKALTLISQNSPHQEYCIQATVYQTGNTILLLTTKNSLLPENTGILLINKKGTRQKLQIGDEVTVKGIIQPIHEPRNPHEFNFKKWRYRQGIQLSMHRATIIEINHSNSSFRIRKTLSSWKKYIQTKITHGIDKASPQAELINAVVLGERPKHTESSSNLIESFRLSGTLHFFAVSGLHVGMVAAIWHYFLITIRTSRIARIIGVILIMILYSGITGFNPPAVRATIMGTIYLSSFLVKRQPSLLNSLSLSTIVVLLWDSHQLFTAGFQLSYGVLLSIILLTQFFQKLFDPIDAIDSFLPKALLNKRQLISFSIRTKFKNALATGSSATLGSSPMVWLHFGIAAPISILASIPLAGMVFTLLILSILSIAVGSISPQAGSWINHANYYVAQTTYSFADIFSKIPYAHWQRSHRDTPNGQIIILDIPNGGAASILDLGGGILLDCSHNNHFDRHILPSLDALQIKPDSLIISHNDSMHTGAAEQVIQNYDIKQLLTPHSSISSDPRPLSKYKSITPQRKQIFAIEDNAYLEILYTPSESELSNLADDNGLVILLHWYHWRILFMGDAGLLTERKLLNLDPEINADVIITGRNKTGYSGSYEFYKTVSPEVIITSHSYFPPEERVTKQTEKMISNLGIKLLNQRDTGGITLTANGEKLQLKPTIKKANAILLYR